MNDDVKALVEQMEAWAPLVSSGYEVPAAGQTMMNASRALTAQAEEIERLRGAHEEIIATVEPEAYKVSADQKPCRHTEALNEIHVIASAALKAAQEVK